MGRLGATALGGGGAAVVLDGALRVGNVEGRLARRGVLEREDAGRVLAVDGGSQIIHNPLLEHERLLHDLGMGTEGQQQQQRAGHHRPSSPEELSCLNVNVDCTVPRARFELRKLCIICATPPSTGASRACERSSRDPYV